MRLLGLWARRVALGLFAGELSASEDRSDDLSDDLGLPLMPRSDDLSDDLGLRLMPRSDDLSDDLGLPRARPSPQRVLPALRAFGPDLLLLSSGFDGGLGDIGNSKLDDKEKYHQGLDLSAADFEWATEQLVSVAAICCPGKVVSVLEGGYGNYEATRDTESGYTVSRAGLAENVGAHLSALAGVNPR